MVNTSNDELAVYGEWNDTERNYRLDRCLHELVEDQVERTPNLVAVSFEDTHLTYRELNLRANVLAQRLRKHGIGPDVLVGIYAERSLELVVGLLGILKAGGCYVPLDPDYPKERIAFMLGDARPPLLLTQERLEGGLPPYSGQVIRLDNDAVTITEEQDAANPRSGVSVDHLAYMIYTSGSTGKPKGVMNVHKAICNRLLWMQEAYPLTAEDRILQKTPHSFDVSVWEFFWPLLTGARLVVARPGGHRDRNYLVDVINRERITTIHFVPSMLALFLEGDEAATCTTLKRMICSGEALSYEVQERFFERFNSAELHNLYGPTEAAVDVTYWACRRGGKREAVPIGRPIANIQMYILDEQRKPVAIGEVGELYIGGIGLARGYLNRPELTAERFVPNPFAQEPDSRLYRTGDLGRYRPDGAIEYLGRNDHQVKIRGNRIELGEVESTLCQHPAVVAAVALAREDTPGDKRLVAYVVTRSGTTVSFNDLRDLLKERLPDYMVPAAFVMLDALPLSLNGKVDRSVLPPPPLERELDDEFVSPRTPLEAELARIWAKLLKVDRVGVHDDFIDAGGSSITVTQLASRAAEMFDVDLSLGGVFDTPTIAGLAEHIEKLQLQ
jgi:amino acid adenylation domain-containing protein